MNTSPDDTPMPRMQTEPPAGGPAEEQLQILSKMDLSSASRPSVIMIEASSGTVAKYKQILHANGYLTTHLEDNGKRRPAPYLDILAWHDTCAAWK